MPEKRRARQSFRFPLSCVSAFETALRQGLQEDGWDWDWTTLGTLSAPDQRVGAKLIARSGGVWAGDSLARALMRIEPLLLLKLRVEDGDAVKPDQAIAELSGPARSLLALERPFLNLASYASGIASRTAALAALIRKACPERTPRLTATRKTLPGYRDIALYGVIAGGGHSHRVSLSGGVLIKENHIAAAGSIARAIEGVRAVAPHGLLVEVEVRDARELDEALKARADGVLLDNFTVREVRAALEAIESSRTRLSGFQRPIVEVSGGLTEENIADYAVPGVDVLSSGSLTHSVRALDLSLLVESRGGLSPQRLRRGGLSPQRLP